MKYRLLHSFQEIFSGTPYRHRNSQLTDCVALDYFEDYRRTTNRPAIQERLDSGSSVVGSRPPLTGGMNHGGLRYIGEKTPGINPTRMPERSVMTGRTANVEIVFEIKILAKSMNKQVNRVINDFGNRQAKLKKAYPDVIFIGAVGVNFASAYVSYEGARTYHTNGKERRHPSQEATSVKNKLLDGLSDVLDELLIICFTAENVSPYNFDFLGLDRTEEELAGIIARTARDHEKRFC